MRDPSTSERERVYSKTLTLCLMSFMCVCSMHTFYTSPYKDWQKYYRTSMLIKSSYTNSKIYSSRHPGSLHRTGVSDRSQPTRYSASLADTADVELVSQQNETFLLIMSSLCRQSSIIIWFVRIMSPYLDLSNHIRFTTIWRGLLLRIWDR